MTRSSKSSPEGVALLISEDGTLVDVIHDSFDLFPKEAESGQSFISCLREESVEKGYNMIERISGSGAAYHWQLDLEKQDFAALFNFSGVKTEKGMLLIGSPDPDKTEEFLNGLMEMNNEQANKLRLFMKQQQGNVSKEDERNIYEDMSAVNNELANMQRKLTKRTAELEKTNKLKNKMLGMAAHDLRNPLTVIQNYATFLIDDHQEEAIFTEDQFQLIKEIRKSSEYMVQIIEDMLDISTFESGNINLEKDSCNLVHLIEEVVSLSRSAGHKKNISIATYLPDSPVSKEIDPHKFRQVLDNLLSNAIKYSKPGTKVEVGINRTEQGGEVTIFVRDHGQGIPEEEIGKLFEPFADISVKATAGEKSTGLGLAIVKKIVEAHGGSIDVDSAVGVGSTFFVTVP